MNYSLHRINEIKSLSSRLYDLIVNFESLISCILKVKGTRLESSDEHLKKIV